MVSWTDEALVVRNYEGLTFTYRNPAGERAPGPAALSDSSGDSARLERRRQRSDGGRTSP